MNSASFINPSYHNGIGAQDHYGHLCINTDMVKLLMMKNNIEALRHARGWSQQMLAEKAGTSGPQINRLEKGQRKLSQEWMARLAVALDCAPSDLMPETAGAWAKQSSPTYFLREPDSDVRFKIREEVITEQHRSKLYNISGTRVDAIIEILVRNHAQELPEDRKRIIQSLLALELSRLNDRT